VHYMLMIYGDEAAGMERFEAMSDAERGEVMGRWNGYTEELKAAGAYRSGDGLQPSATAKTVRGDGSRHMVTDGPFAETKEQLGGFYVVDVPGEAEALEWAARMPNLPYGSVEVRPVMIYEDA
jgi:hypothetical protein